MAKEWRRADDFLKLILVFPFAKDNLYQTFCSECSFSIAGYVRSHKTVTVVPAIERAVKFFSGLGLKHFRYVKSLQFIIIGNETGKIETHEAESMLDALEILLHHRSPSMKLKDLRLGCQVAPIDYYLYGTPTKKRSVRGYVLEGLNPRINFLRPRDKSLKALWRGALSLRELNRVLLSRSDTDRPIDFMTRLPPELRLRIYDNLMEDAPTTYHVGGLSPVFTCENRRDLITLLTINAEMKHELSKLLYSSCQFRFDTCISGTNLGFIDRIGSANAMHIRNIIIKFDVHQIVTIQPIKTLLSKLPNFGTLNLDASTFDLHSAVIDCGPRRMPLSFLTYHSYQRASVFNVPETNSTKIEFHAITSWITPLTIPFHQPELVKPDVLREAFQASIDGKVVNINHHGIMKAYWPGGTPITEKGNKAKKTRL